jgi:prolyl-tRNA synthetase
MYPAFAKWIRSYRDLPVQVNQWCSVVRMEMSHCTPFIRTREFLWQEGHTAHQHKEQADKMVRTILSYYKAVYEELLAIPVVEGQKTEKEKFAGGFYTTTVEAFIPSVGRGVQGATSHQLGQNFGKMFDIQFEDPSKTDGSKLIPWQTSWGLTTRSQGVTYMVHSDDSGLILPPRVAVVQVVLVPVGISAKMKPEAKQALFDAVAEIAAELRAAGVRAKEDVRDNYSPGWKFAHWELKGVPIRIEVGPKELEQGTLKLKRRCDGLEWQEERGAPATATGAAAAASAAASSSSTSSSLAERIKVRLNEIHDFMLSNARKVRAEKTVTTTDWKEFTPALQNKCLVMAPWCGATKCEDLVKSRSAEESKILNAQQAEDARAPSMGAKALCIPFEQPAIKEGLKCIICPTAAKHWVLFGRSY